MSKGKEEKKEQKLQEKSTADYWIRFVGQVVIKKSHREIIWIDDMWVSRNHAWMHWRTVEYTDCNE